MEGTGNVDEEKEAAEVAVVVVADAVVDPWTCAKGSQECTQGGKKRKRRTVVVHLQDAALALAAVVGAGRFVGCVA
jgi:hypothetical protein